MHLLAGLENFLLEKSFEKILIKFLIKDFPASRKRNFFSKYQFPRALLGGRRARIWSKIYKKSIGIIVFSGTGFAEEQNPL